MKRVLLVLAGVALVAVFSIYILEIDLFKNDTTVETKGPVDISMQKSSEKSSEVVSAPKSEAISLQKTTQIDTQEISTQETASPNQTQALIKDGKWILVWRDTFDIPSVDLESWTEVERKDNFNNELQYYSPLNSYIQDGCLFLTAKQETKDKKPYTSGMVQTEYKQSFLYGRVEAKIKLPDGKGIFPAFWLLSENYEIDIMEMVGHEPDIIYGVNHYSENGQLYKTFGMHEDVNWDEFHVYALEWEPDELRWYFDDTMYYKTKNNISNEEMYILFTMAVGGVWPGSPNEKTIFPSSMVIDEISLYRAIE